MQTHLTAAYPHPAETHATRIALRLSSTTLPINQILFHCKKEWKQILHYKNYNTMIAKSESKVYFAKQKSLDSWFELSL